MNGRDALRAATLAVAVAACSTSSPTSSLVLPTPSSEPSGPASPALDPSASSELVQPTVKLPTEVPATSYWSQRPPEPLLIGAAVRVVATELNIREKPSTSAKLIDTFRAGQVILVSGLPPVDADGYTWYLGTGPFGDGKGELQPLPADGAIYATNGWFAASKRAVPYVEPATTRCPTVIDLRNLGAMVPAERLDCFAGRTIEFEGAYGCPGCLSEVFGRFEPAWLANPNEVNLLSLVGSNLGGHGLNLRFPPALDGRPATGSILRVRGHFDDSTSSDCSITLIPWDSTPAMVPHVVPGSIARLWCRQMFVVESYEVTGTDPSYDPEL